MALASKQYQPLLSIDNNVLEAGMAILERSSVTYWLSSSTSKQKDLFSEITVTNELLTMTVKTEFTERSNATISKTFSAIMVEGSNTASYDKPGASKEKEISCTNKSNLCRGSAACRWEHILQAALKSKRTKPREYKCNRRRNAICEEDLLEREGLVHLLTEFITHKRLLNYNLI